MGISLMRMDADGGPDVGIALGHADNVIPFALPGRDVEKAGYAATAGTIEHLVLALGEPVVIEVAVAVDQPHAASSSSSSSLGNKGTGCAIAAPPAPLSINAINRSAEAGMTGATATASLRIATTSVPSTAAIRSGSVLRSAHGA